MLNADDLRKQLTASEAYNRFMEKRVRMLEMEVKLLQSAAVESNHNPQHSPALGRIAEAPNSGSPTSGGNSTPRKFQDVKDMTATQVLDELMRLRVDHKTTLQELKQTKKDLSMASANLQHFTAKEQQQRQRNTQLVEEVRQLRSLLPSHLFDGSSLGNGEGASRGVSYLSSDAGFSSPGATSRRGGSVATSQSDDGPELTKLRTSASAVVQETTLHVQQLVADVERNADQLFTLPLTSYHTATHMPSSVPLNLAECPTQKERVDRWRSISTRIHTVMKFSKKEMLEQETGVGGGGLFGATKSSGPQKKKMYDRTQAQWESLISLVDRNVDMLKELVIELPKGMAAYLTKCRSGIGIVVDGQRANTPSALASIKAQAGQLSQELSRHRDDFAGTLQAVREQTATLCAVLMSCVDGAIGLNMYRGIPNAMKLVAALETQVAILVGFDHAVELDAVRDHLVRAEGGSGESEAWYVRGLTLESEMRRLSEIDPGRDRIEKLDILTIKRLFPDTLAAATSMAAAGGMNPACAETVVTLETIKTAASNLQKMFRGQLNPSLTTSATPLGPTAADESSCHKAVQCNLQQQKMQMTENELHIARLANIRSNWFESAVQARAASPNGPSQGREGSQGGADKETPVGGGGSSSPQTPRGGGRSGNAIKSPRGRPSSLDVARMIEDGVARLQLCLPPNFGPVKSRVQRYSTETDGYLFHFGRRIISVHVTGNGGSIAVHIGGGYVTLEEFCFKYVATESLMYEQKQQASGESHQLGGGSGRAFSGSPPNQHLEINTNEVLEVAGGRDGVTVPKLRGALGGKLAQGSRNSA